MASMEDKIVDALKKTAGMEGKPNKNIEELGHSIAKAVEEFVMEQEFRVVKLKTKVDLDSIGITKDQSVDVAPNTLMGPYAPLISSLKQLAGLIPGAVDIIDKVETVIKKATKRVSAGGASVPAWTLKKIGDGLVTKGASSLEMPNYKNATKAIGDAGSSVVKLMEGDIKNGANK